MSTTDEPAGAWPFRRPGPAPSGPAELSVHLVSHTHWDREWYAPAEWFRRRLVITVDRVLDLLDADPGWAFVLDGQAIVDEDYLSARPDRAAELTPAVAACRLASRTGSSTQPAASAESSWPHPWPKPR